MKPITVSIFAILFLLFFSCRPKLEPNMLALVGGTLLDFDNYGKTSDDIEAVVVLIHGKQIVKVEKAADFEIPSNTKVLDVSGKFLVPGLIDVFATLNDQAYANAFLYMGVTTIVGLESPRRGPIFWEANPSPEIVRCASYYGEAVWSDDEETVERWAVEDEIKKAIDSLAKTEVKVLLVHYGVKPTQLLTIVEKCREHGIITIGELGYSKVKEAIEAGINGFVHISRYSIDIVPDEIKKGYEDFPFGEPRIRAYKYFEDFDPETDSVLKGHAELLSRSNVALIPTHSIWYPSYPFAKNPWDYPIAAIIEEDQIHMPVDRETGKWTALRNTVKWDTLIWSKKLVRNILGMEKQYVNNGAKYLTGSGTDAFGTMPGISLHSELEMLQRAGLSNREALAAATTNFSKLFGWERIGQIKAGSEADILVLSRNPVEDLDNLDEIQLILLDGKIIKRESLMTMGKNLP